MVIIDSHAMEKNAMEVNGYRQLFGYQHFQKFFFLQQKKETHTCLDQHEGEKMMTEFTFPLNVWIKPELISYFTKKIFVLHL